MKFLNNKTISLGFLVVFSALSAFLLLTRQDTDENINTNPGNSVEKILHSPTPTPFDLEIPESYIIPQRHHTFQTFNNCGPATLSMALSYWGINVSQQELGSILRPYQVPGGDNDDKSVTLHEVADLAEEYGLYAYLRPNGTPEKLELFISQGIPVVARTWLEANEDIGHYRVVRGYDRTTSTLIQDDSLQGKDLTYSYSDFNNIWQPFNYEYLIIVDDSKKEIAERILDEELDEKTSWENALDRIEDETQKDPNNWHLIFAKSRIYYYLGDYGKSVEEFEKAEDRISFRTLWYQIEPIQSYFELGNYDRVFEMSDNILNNQNRAFSELYHIRGQIYLAQGNTTAARAEFEKAVRYKYNYQPAVSALENL